MRLARLASTTGLFVGLGGIAWAGLAPAAPPQVPEPSSLSLLAVAVGAAAWIKFRGRR